MIVELAASLGLAPPALLALGVAAGALLFVLLRQARRRRRRALETRLGAEAAVLGIRFHRDGEPPPPVGAAAPARGALTFSGSSRGLSWRAEVEHDPPELRRVRRVQHERTRVTVAAGALPPGRFVLVMALPEGSARWEAAPPEGDGILASIARRAMEAAVDLYAGGYFGARQRALVTVAGARSVPAPAGFWVLANDEVAAARLLRGPAPARLAALRAGEGGPWRGRPFHSFGLLLSPEGLTLGCQLAVREPAAIRDLAEWAAGLAEVARSP
jgi:hypothetical protein